MRTLAILLLAATVAVVSSCGGDGAATTDKRVLVIGVDGMDPAILQGMLRANKMPNFAKLAAQGAFLPLGTAMPPQSPVAWSNFISGMNPGGHGIFDFLRHDHHSLQIAPSTSTMEPDTILGFHVGDKVINLRQGKAFWEYLEDRDIPTTVFRVPANYPPVGTKARTFSGMGTPDMRGSDGTFTYYTDDPPAGYQDYAGGEVVPVTVKNHVVRSELKGPPEPFADFPPPATTVPLTVYVGPERKVARIDVGEGRIILKPGEWSGWVRAWFPQTIISSASGIVRFYLKSLEPNFRLYATAVNIDPAYPAQPIATPSGAAEEQAAALGPFYTKGMAVDTKANRYRVLNDDEFLLQALSVLDERKRLLEYELDRFKKVNGFLFFYFSTVDLSNHMLWRVTDDKHPIYPDQASPRVRAAMESLYREVDRVLGRVMKEVDDKTTLMVMSDHGFAPFYRQVHVNNWLQSEGLLALYDPKSVKGSRLNDDVDWLRTKAYAVGFNGIYLNLFGREANGLVTPAKRDEVLNDIERRLLALKDPKTGRRVVARVYRPEKLYSGPFVKAAPDLIVGYSRGHRASNETALGEFGAAVIEDNEDPWSGDHMMAAEEVPGILLVNRKVSKRAPTLVDLPVTILELFGIEKPEQMVGTSLFKTRE